VVSHHVRETLPVCDQAVVVANGTLVFDGTPEALQASQDPLLRQFLDGSPHGPIAFDDVTGQRAA
ncbi:MAG: ABC transporter ATP-binding protein, partial [Thermomonas sp.]